MNDPVAAIVQPAEVRHPQYGASKKQRRPARDPRTPLDHRAQLRVKIKSLAEEQKIIRREETRTGSITVYDSLHRHRVNDVRPEARAAHLAMCFIKGTPFHVAECPVKTGKEPQQKIRQRDIMVVDMVPKITRLVQKFGSTALRAMDQAQVTRHVMGWLKGDYTVSLRRKFAKQD